MLDKNLSLEQRVDDTLPAKSFTSIHSMITGNSLKFLTRFSEEHGLTKYDFNQILDISKNYTSSLSKIGKYLDKGFSMDEISLFYEVREEFDDHNETDKNSPGVTFNYSGQSSIKDIKVSLDVISNIYERFFNHSSDSEELNEGIRRIQREVTSTNDLTGKCHIVMDYADKNEIFYLDDVLDIFREFKKDNEEYR